MASTLGDPWVSVPMKTPTPGKTRMQAVGAYVGAVLLCLAVLVWVMQLWNADFAILLYYWLAYDTFFYSMLTKGLIDNGWYLHNRFVGMPTGLDLHDFPLADNLHFLFLKLISLGTSDYAVVVNLYFLLTFPLTVLAALFVLRRFRLSYPPALVGSLLFAFLPYHFLRGEGHLFYAAYYLVPLAVMLALWICLGEPLFFCKKENRQPAWEGVSSKGIASIVICALIASGGVYYAFFAGFFLLVAGVGASFRQRSCRPLLTAGILLTVLCLVFVINVSPSILYVYRHGRNPIVARRIPADAESYGMKIVQLLLPVTGHRISYLADFKAVYNRQAPLVNENDTTSLGVIGSLGFFMLIGGVVCGTPKVRNAELFSSLSVLNISAVLLATIGGFSSLFAFLISSQIRAYNRMSVYIAFFSVFTVVLLLDSLAQRWAKSRTGRSLLYGLLGFILLTGLLDQTTLSFVPPYEQLKAEYTSDADFVRRIEASVPGNAIIFQLPYVPFPENPPVHNMLDYDHFRGYLHSETLRWSYGAMRGRVGDLWQQELAAKPVDQLVETLSLAGYSGIYLDRSGYAEQGAALETKLAELLGSGPIVSANQRLTFFNLAAYTQKLRAQYTEAEWQARERALHPVLLQWTGGFSDLEGTAEENWRWCSAQGELMLYNPSRQARPVRLEMSLGTGYEELSNLQIDSPWFSEQLKINQAGQFFAKTLTLPPGQHVIRFTCDARRVHAPLDLRFLVFQVMNFRLQKGE